MKLVAALAGAVAVALLFASSAGAATLKADYRFADSLASSVPGAPGLSHVATIGSTSEFVDDSVDGAAQRVLEFPQGNGLLMPSASLVNGSAYTVITTFRFEEVSSYRRLLGFAPSVADEDEGLYVYEGGLYFYDYEDEGGIGPEDVIAPDTYVDVAFTRNGLGRSIAYIDGAEHFDFVDPGSAGVIGSDGLYFFRDFGQGDGQGEASAGRVARIRIYDGPLTAAEVAAVEQTGGLLARATRSGKPQLEKRGKRFKVAPGILLECPDEGVACATEAEVRRKGAKPAAKPLGRFAGQLPASSSTEPRIKLTKKAVKLLKRKGKLKVTTRGTITPSSGHRATATSAGKLKLKRKR